MGRYGKNMRDCCDSVAQPGTPHIVGCKHYVLPPQEPFDYRLELQGCKSKPPAALSGKE